MAERDAADDPELAAHRVLEGEVASLAQLAEGDGKAGRRLGQKLRMGLGGKGVGVVAERRHEVGKARGSPEETVNGGAAAVESAGLRLTGETGEAAGQV